MTSAPSDLAIFIHAISDPARRRILLALKEKRSQSVPDGLCAGDVEQHVKLSQPTVSHHMRILEKAGLVEVKRQGHWRVYRRNEKKIAALIRSLKREF